MTDYRKLQRQGAVAFLELFGDKYPHWPDGMAVGEHHWTISVTLNPDQIAILQQLRAIPKPGNPNLPKTGGKRPGAGRKKKITEVAK